MVLATAAVAVRAQDAKLSAADAKRLVAEWCGADAKKAAAARAKLEATRAEDRKLIAAALASAPFTPPKGRRPLTERTFLDTIELPEAETKRGRFIIKLPKEYDDRKPMPAVFKLHGSGDDCQSYAKNIPDPKAPCITVTPEIPSADRMSWDAGWRLIDALFRYLPRNYNVDLERVYMTGYSAGSGASFTVAQIWPHRVAGFYAMGRLHWAFHVKPEPCMDALREIPGYFVVGLRDTDERVNGYRTAEAYYAKTKLPGVFHFVEKKEHEYIGEHDTKAHDFLFKTSRKPQPKKIRSIFFEYRDDKDAEIRRRRWWLEAAEGGFAADAEFTASVEGNVVAVQAPKLREFYVHVNDALVDLDKPVTVKLDDKEVHNAVVERAVAFLLDGFDAERDRGRLFWNRIHVKR
ncbi:MAG TPA: hypothetical protein VEI02_07270 [Planctomycetota bacterium]|nr:hypothetical protein [Planctomycetota bacterium]